MRVFIFFLFIVSIIFGCKQVPAKEVQEELILEMRQTRCFGICPAYEVKIYNSGKAEYEGEYEVPFVGKKNFQMDKKDLAILLEAWAELSPYELKDNYKSDKLDLPTTYISFLQNGRKKDIVDYDQAPVKLKTFEKLVRELTFKYLNER